MAHVFITYIHEHAELARAIKTFLEATTELPLDFMMIRKPLNVFVSSEPGSILPGADWQPILKQELTSAKVVIPLLTNGSLSRPWVNLETGAAWIMDKKIIPAWCEQHLFKGNLPKPYVDWQIVHLPEGADQLRRAVERYVGATFESSPPRMTPSKDLSILQAVFERFYKAEADSAPPCWSRDLAAVPFPSRPRLIGMSSTTVSHRMSNVIYRGPRHSKAHRAAYSPGNSAVSQPQQAPPHSPGCPTINAD